ncbi:hypothetical protein NQD34_011825 [Periophthalmus magnuspinnatus]|nr:hypothetical protein NQD34_011825 [Periophthalmus magnuspinnatus]
MGTRTRGLGFIILSAAWVHFVSAGGAYCAKTARARAAALGLDYPGVHGAPDLSGPPPYSAQHPSAPHHQHFPNNPQPPAMDYNTYYKPPREFPHFQPAGYGSHSPTQSNFLSKLSGGGPQNNRKSNFEPVEHDGPLTHKQPPTWLTLCIGLRKVANTHFHLSTTGMGLVLGPLFQMDMT